MIPLNPHPAAASQPQRAGHIRIPNSLYDAITAFPFKLTTLRVLLAVLRKTEGYGKQEDDLSASQLASLCGAMSRQHVTTALNELAALNVIRKRPGRYGCVVGLNRDPAQWRQPARRAGVSGTGTGPQDGPLSESTAPDRPVAGQSDRPGFGQTTDNLQQTTQTTFRRRACLRRTGCSASRHRARAERRLRVRRDRVPGRRVESRLP